MPSTQGKMLAIILLRFQGGYGSYFPHTCAIVTREAAGNLVGRRRNISKFLTIDLLGFGSHPSDRQNLAVLLDSLLELGKQYAQP